MPRPRAGFPPFAVSLAILVVAGCGSGGATGGGGGGAGRGTGGGANAGSTNGPADGYAIKVRDGDGPVHRIDASALKALPDANVRTPQSGGKKVQHGPLVRTVLRAAGITDFTTLTVKSLDGTATFPSRQIGDDVVLDFNRRGTTKLAGAHLPTKRWQRDITELDAHP